MPNIENLVCKCFSCGEKYDLFSTNLEDRQVIIENEKLILRILICPLCHVECVVQIDNEKTLKLFKEQMSINTTLANIMVSQGSNSNKYTKQYRKLKGVSKILLQERNKLALKYNNSVYYFGNENKKININEPAMYIAGNN